MKQSLVDLQPAASKSDRLLARRTLVCGGAAGLLAASLAGCGFELRKAPEFAFRSITVPGESAYLAQLRRTLRSAGMAHVITPAQLQAGEQGEVVFDVLNETRDQIILSANSMGQVRELRLRLRISFRLRTPQGKEVIPATEIMQTRDITYNETAALAKESEQQLLYRDMINDIVQQTLRQLAAVKTL